MAELNGLPPGWDSKVDERTGKSYFINHFTKTTTWEDPRTRYRQFQNNSRPMSNVPVEYIPLQDMKTTNRSPVTLKSAKIKDSSFTATNAYVTDSDESVAKISAMFPTVSETHIKLLLKKYLNREALVISALQVEKYPITTPGPFSTPPPQRNILVKGAQSNTGSPVLRGLVGLQGFRNSPKPHSSPKLKLRYMKSIFPEADETVIHEVLQNNDNSIQKSSEVLKDMGYVKKDTMKFTPPKVESVTSNEMQNQENGNPAIVISLPHVITCEEKQLLKEKLQNEYKDVAEHLITIALESVHFNEDRASQILNIMKQEDSETNNINKHKKSEGEPKLNQLDAVPSMSQSCQLPVSQSRQSIKSLLKGEKKDENNGFSRNMSDDTYSKSLLLSNTMGHNPDLSKGTNEKLLLESYVQWQGSNSTFQKGPQGLAKGPNKNLLSNKMYKPCGPNAELHKGPSYGLSKGSIYNQLKT